MAITTVDGITATEMLRLAGEEFIGVDIPTTGINTGKLVLTRRNGSTFVAGQVVGATGATGPAGADGTGWDEIIAGDNLDAARTGNPANKKLWIMTVDSPPNNGIAGDRYYVIEEGETPIDPGPGLGVTSGLIHHWRALDVTGHADAIALTTWPARVGGVSFVAPAGKEPIFKVNDGPGGRPYVKFTAANEDVMNAAVGAIAQPNTVIIVGRYAVNTASRRLITSQSITSPNRVYIGQEATTFSAYAGTLRNGPTADTLWHFFAGIYNGASSNIRVDATSSAGNMGADTISGLRIGGNGATPVANFVDMEIAEIIVFNRAIDGTEFTTIRNALQAYYELP